MALSVLCAIEGKQHSLHARGIDPVVSYASVAYSHTLSVLCAIEVLTVNAETSPASPFARELVLIAFAIISLVSGPLLESVDPVTPVGRPSLRPANPPRSVQSLRSAAAALRVAATRAPSCVAPPLSSSTRSRHCPEHSRPSKRTAPSLVAVPRAPAAHRRCSSPSCTAL